MKTINEVYDELPEEIFKVLNHVGVSQSTKGYDYLALAIDICNKSIRSKPSLTKDIYPAIAKLYGVQWQSVERCMRFSIEKAFEVCNPDIIYEYFGNSIDPLKGKADVTQFLYTLANTVYRRLRISQQ